MAKYVWARVMAEFVGPFGGRLCVGPFGGRLRMGPFGGQLRVGPFDGQVCEARLVAD